MKNLEFVKNKLEKLSSPNRERCLKLLSDEEERFSIAKGSGYKHHAWHGGWAAHISETMKVADGLYNQLELLKPFSLKFEISDVYLVLFLHDLEKAWKYFPPFPKMTKEKNEEFRQNLIKKYEIELTDDHKNALRHIETEKDYNPKERTQGPLAAFCHCCDTISARIYYDGLD